MNVQRKPKQHNWISHYQLLTSEGWARYTLCCGNERRNGLIHHLRWNCYSTFWHFLMINIIKASLTPPSALFTLECKMRESGQRRRSVGGSGCVVSKGFKCSICMKSMHLKLNCHAPGIISALQWQWELKQMPSNGVMFTTFTTKVHMDAHFRSGNFLKAQSSRGLTCLLMLSEMVKYSFHWTVS